MRGIHRSPVDPTHKWQWRGVLVFSLICTWRSGWANIEVPFEAPSCPWCHCNDLWCVCFIMIIIIIIKVTSKPVGVTTRQVQLSGRRRSLKHKCGLLPLSRYIRFLKMVICTQITFCINDETHGCAVLYNIAKTAHPCGFVMRYRHEVGTIYEAAESAANFTPVVKIYKTQSNIERYI